MASAPTAAAATPGSAPVPAANASGSLYVGDLSPAVTEALLFELFNQVGPVSSIRVCRDAATRRSLGYAYVNFHNVNDAERALDTLNFQSIKGRPCRIMWSHRDPAIRKNTKSNIFIKNLDASIDNKALYDTFSAYGSILSCKVATDSSNRSRGYGFVHYETEEGAAQAIEQINGMLLNGKKVYVGLHERRSERQGGGSSKFTNIYVKDIPAAWDAKRMETEFSKFGKITSLALQTDAEGNHKGFGFVNFETHEEAIKAVEEGKNVDLGEADKCLFVARFQKRAERAAFLAKKRDDSRREKMERYKNLNLYVKNLEDDVDDEKLKKMFEDFGETTSCVVMKDDKGQSRGFGFVCFTTVEDATKALNGMNGKMIGQKPIYVNRAQRKEERRMHLENQFQANMAGQRMQPMAPVFYAPPAGVMGQPGMMYQQPVMNRARYPAQPGMRGYPMYHQQMKQRGRAQAQGRPGMPQNARGAGQHKYRQNTRYPREQQMPVQMPPAAPPAVITQQPGLGGELTSSMLANADPGMQKQLLGERLFPLVVKEQPELAGKITGMLLEMETSDIIHLLENETELHNKVVEALEVLQSHSGEGEGATA